MLGDTLYDSQSMRRFVGINLLREDVHDAITLLKFYDLLEKHDPEMHQTKKDNQC
jgi:IS5 family transposase